MTCKNIEVHGNIEINYNGWLRCGLVIDITKVEQEMKKKY